MVVTCRSGQDVGLHGVGHVAKVAAGFAVAVDVNRLTLQQRCRPFGDDGGIGAVGVLPGAKHIEVAQANGFKAVAAGKHAGIQLVHVFGHGVGAERLANVFFHLGQRGVVAIGAAAGRVGKAFDLGVAGGDQHVQKAGDVGVVGGHGVGQAAGHTAEGGLVQDVVDGAHRDGGAAPTRGHRGMPGHGALAVGQVADVALYELEVGPLLGGDQGLHLLKVALVAGGKVVEANHALVELEQGFEQVAANEAGHASHQPGLGVLAQFGLDVFVAGHVGCACRRRSA